MAQSNTILIAWDSSIWISWLVNESRPNHESDGVVECVQLTKEGKVIIVSSTVLYAEVSELRMSTESQLKYTQFLRRRNVKMVGINPRIGAISLELKTFYRQLSKRDGLKELTENDAHHMATAIYMQAEAFYTFDNGGKNSRSLLSLNGNVAGHNLVVCKPPITQYRLL